MSAVAAGPPDVTGASVVLPARPEPLRFDPAHTALIVVDMQNAYASPGGYLDLAGFDISGAAAAIEAVAASVQVARRAGIPVIYLQNGWDPGYQEAGGPGSPNWYKSNALRTMRARPELAGTLLAKGGWDYALVDRLTPQPGDIVVPKARYSAFPSSNIDSILRARAIRTLVFTGIATNVCVESTLRDAFHLEYFGVVLADATHQAGPAFAQQAALYNIETFFGWVSSVAEFRCALTGSSTAEVLANKAQAKAPFAPAEQLDLVDTLAALANGQAPTGGQ
ncbi:MAG: pyrimidine utilization protein B [Janthinobacterium lividum]